MKTLNGSEFERRFAERYNYQPLGWRCFYTLDKKGNLSMVFVNIILREQYWLKSSSPYSHNCLGFVGTLEEDFPFLNDPFYDKDFGVRSLNLTSEEREKFFRRGEDGFFNN